MTPKPPQFGETPKERAIYIMWTFNNYLNSCNKYCDNMIAADITPKKNDVLFDEPRHCNFIENIHAQTFPEDYNFIKMPYRYMLGMSVPPVMTAQIATNIYDKWLSKL